MREYRFVSYFCAGSETGRSPVVNEAEGRSSQTLAKVPVKDYI